MRDVGRAVIVAAAGVFLAGCATTGNGGTPPVYEFVEAEPNPSREREEQAAMPEGPGEIVVDEMVAPEEAQEGEEGEQEPAEDPREVVEDRTQEFTVVPNRVEYRGGAVEYNFVPQNIYKLFVAPYRVTDIRLQPGESMVQPPASGDTSNFVVETGHGFVDGRRTEHVYLKAVYPDRATTLTISTDKRTYNFEVEAYEETYMPMVQFRYPLDAFQQQRRAAEQARQQIYMNTPIEAMDFGYEVIPHNAHKPRWMPSIVFTDGSRTYIQFHSAVRASYAPVLFVIEGDESRRLVNYRVIGDYYIVDEVVDHGELVLDVNEGNIVTIKRVRE